MRPNGIIWKVLVVAALSGATPACGWLTEEQADARYVTVEEGVAWGTIVSTWAEAIAAAVCMMEEAVYDSASTPGPGGHTHTHVAPTPNLRYCPPGPPPDPPVPPPPPPDWDD
jgi:hypothetical protein